MRSNGTIKHIIFVAFSNIIKLISSILIGFVIPYILGLTNYGYYKIFTLYLAYVGLFHFGFIDGIYLKFGGVDYHNLKKESFRTYFNVLLLIELIISIIGISVSIFFLEGERKIIFLLLFLNLIAVNLTTYYQFISQITSRFKEYSTRLILLSITNIIIVMILYIFSISDYRIYIGLIVIVNYFLLLWYLYTYRDITFGKKQKLRNSKSEIVFFFKTGIPLLLANLTSTIVILVDRHIVEFFFTVEIFGVYAFAYSILAMITVVVSAVGVVLYPMLKKTNNENIPNNYANLNLVIIIIVLIGLIGYFPLLWIIPNFLPDYIDSLSILRIALPGLVLTSSISAIKHNFFKITDKNLSFFIISIIAIVTNIALNFGAYHFYGTTVSIAISSFIGISLWYISIEIYMVRKYKIHWKYNALLITIGVSSFYAISFIDNLLLSSLIYSLFIIILVALNFNKLKLIAGQ
jgi:O-antigen/teichoic acid export membrane protein